MRPRRGVLQHRETSYSRLRQRLNVRPGFQSDHSNDCIELIVGIRTGPKMKNRGRIERDRAGPAAITAAIKVDVSNVRWVLSHEKLSDHPVRAQIPRPFSES